MNNLSTALPPVGRRPARPRRVIHEQLLEQLRDLIVEGELAGGARVPERLLCERFAVSRTPLREALKALAAEGLIELLPNRGARVVRLTPEAVAETLKVIGALEALAGQLACERLTADELGEIRACHFQMLAHHARRDLMAYFKANQAIHQAIVAASGNAVLKQTYDNLSGRIRRARYAANLDQARWDEAVAEHETMLRALQARDGERLAGIMRLHLDNKSYALSAQAAGDSP
ncbi:MAG TPA: GntR family transcriptional regulator [Candidatus Sulfotelmatobacter sp.]|nr:GntR family transcriptional regulator [Candidatus Sulfotelmatobacter sp.]